MILLQYDDFDKLSSTWAITYNVNDLAKLGIYNIAAVLSGGVAVPALVVSEYKKNSLQVCSSIESVPS